MMTHLTLAHFTRSRVTLGFATVGTIAEVAGSWIFTYRLFSIRMLAIIAILTKGARAADFNCSRCKWEIISIKDDPKADLRGRCPGFLRYSTSAEHWSPGNSSLKKYFMKRFASTLLSVDSFGVSRNSLPFFTELGHTWLHLDPRFVTKNFN